MITFSLYFRKTQRKNNWQKNRKKDLSMSLLTLLKKKPQKQKSGLSTIGWHWGDNSYIIWKCVWQKSDVYMIYVSIFYLLYLGVILWVRPTTITSENNIVIIVLWTKMSLIPWYYVSTPNFKLQSWCFQTAWRHKLYLIPVEIERKLF